MAKFPSLKDKGIELSGKVVLVRTGMDVPLNESGLVTDESRIREAIPTIQHLVKKGAKVVLLTHIGRPAGKVVENQRVEAVAVKLSILLKQEVKSIKECVGSDAEAAIKKMKDGEILFLENLRFHPEEEANDDNFARQLAGLGDAYVNDAFSNSHRSHASMTGIPKYLPSYAGLLLEKEIKAITAAVENPKRPFIAILGGAKVSDKIGVIRNLGMKADRIIIGGAMIFTFYKSRGFETGLSKLEPDKVSMADDLLNEYSQKIVLPIDIVTADRVSNDANSQVVAASEIPKGWVGLDIGPESVKLFKKELSDAGTVVWNGPMGMFELPRFAEGTFEVAQAISQAKATTVIGGGDTLAAVEKAGLTGKFTHTSTGGGAMLELLEGKTLPGIAALLEAAKDS